MVKERCDYSAAISIEQLNMLYKKIKLLENLYGDGSMLLNKAEEDYSKYGPMKMAAIAKHDLVKGSKLTMGDVHFCRTSQSTGYFANRFVASCRQQVSRGCEN